ncbi:MAG: sugar ABC transporter ATP-binding protein [Desulfobacterales bacterium]|nr:sugar ABC transporter ATP-binding protein [Desulfobacterales bacterium]
MPQTSENNMILSLNNITKTFPGVVALDDVQFELRKGEVHTLIGENGAGKSTLIKIISGAHQATSGEIIFDNEKILIKDPHHAKRLGIYTIYQEVMYIPDLSIAENMFLGSEILKNGLISHRNQIKETRKLFEKFGYSIDPEKMAKDLNVAELRMISIIKALNNDVKVLILDEPTASLTDREKDLLFKNIRLLKEKGTGIIYISHRLEELKEIGDRTTVFRNGQYIDTLELENVKGIDDLVPLMIGHEVKDKFPKIKAQIGEPLLRVKGLTRKGFFKNVSLECHAGEVLGIFGLVGCGFEDVPRSVFGAEDYETGTVEVNSGLSFKTVKKQSPKSALDKKISYIPRDRKHEGLIMNLSIKENIVMSCYHRFVTAIGLIRRKAVREIANQYRDIMRIKAPNMSTKVENLSGGNQQKVILARSLCHGGKIFLFNEPTAGIDVGSKVEIYQAMNQLTAEGSGVVMVSYELPEIMGMSDRIIIMYNGQIVKEFNIEDASEDEILKYAFGHGNDENIAA